MKIKVTYRPLVTKEVEIDDKFRELLTPIPDDVSPEEWCRLDRLSDELPHAAREKLPDCDKDIYSIVGPGDVWIYES